jgi:serine/threonine protein kinase
MLGHTAQEAIDLSDFFNAEIDDGLEIPRQPLPQIKSPPLEGNLGFFICSKASFDHNDDDEQLVAVKILSKSILKWKQMMEPDLLTKKVKVRTALQQVEREIALMKKLLHPNLVPLYEVIDSP